MHGKKVSASKKTSLSKGVYTNVLPADLFSLEVFAWSGLTCVRLA